MSKVISLINQTLDNENAVPRPEITLGGSYARGTWLKGSHDIDFFLLYPVDFPREKLESVAIRSATDAMTDYAVSMRYAEHPYVESFVDGIRVNIVPCYAVAPGQWRSSADRSPYHTKYIASKMDERLRLEVRLFKKFVKSARVYGAEVKIQGFSGYVSEVLTLKFGSFVNTLHGLAKLKPNEVISLGFRQAVCGFFQQRTGYSRIPWIALEISEQQSLREMLEAGSSITEILSGTEAVGVPAAQVEERLALSGNPGG